MPAAEASINDGSGSPHQCRVTSGRSTTLTISTMTCAEIRATGIMVVGSWVWKWRYVDGVTFGCFLVSLFSSSLLRISAQYKWRRHGFYHLRISVHGRWSLPVRRIRRKVAFELYRSVAGLMSSYECVRGMIVSVFLLLSFPTLVRGSAAQEVCT